jgi:hypothetical protein
MKLQATFNKIDDWAKKWRFKINQNKSTHITFTLRNQTCPIVQMGNVDLPQRNEVKYLSMRLDRRLTWAEHIKKTAQSKSETNALPTPKKINTVNRKQTPPIQRSTQNPSARMAFSYGRQTRIPTSKSSSAFNQRFFYLFWKHLGT